jgi:hypothetical protein
MIEKIFFVIHRKKKPGKPVENDWMTSEEKPEKPSKPGWKKYQRFGTNGWLLKTRQSCSAKNQRKNSPFGKKPLDTKKPLGMIKNTRNEQALLIRSALGPKRLIYFFMNNIFNLKGNCVLRTLKNSFAIF